MDTSSESGNDSGGNFSSTTTETVPASVNSDGNSFKVSKPSSTALKCDRLIASLQDCVKKHPVQQDTVCAHLHRAAGWCLIRIACPVQVEDLEDCVGVQHTSSKMPLGPPLVPDRCRQQALKLEMCIAAHQVEPS